MAIEWPNRYITKKIRNSFLLYVYFLQTSKNKSLILIYIWFYSLFFLTLLIIHPFQQKKWFLYFDLLNTFTVYLDKTITKTGVKSNERRKGKDKGVDISLKDHQFLLQRESTRQLWKCYEGLSTPNLSPNEILNYKPHWISFFVRVNLFWCSHKLQMAKWIFLSKSFIQLLEINIQAFLFLKLCNFLNFLTHSLIKMQRIMRWDQSLAALFTPLPASHLLLCSPVPNRPWSGTSPWRGG